VVDHRAESEEGTALTDPGELPQILLADGKPLPLRHTDVKIRIESHFALTTVTQVYENTRKQVIDTQYTFPLPENAVVTSVEMLVGDRRIVGDVLERQEARDTYERAAAEGKTSTLLEQERRNVFHQRLANIPPGEKVEVTLGYLQPLTYDEGVVEVVFPMVVGPRYHPKGKEDPGVDVPIVGEGTRSGRDIAIDVEVLAGRPLDRFWVPTHDVESEITKDGLRVRLADEDEIPNRDFVLRYQAAERRPEAQILAADGHFTMLLTPAAGDVDGLVGMREVVFVVDVSGSMSGEPLALCKESVREALGRLRPVDTFNIVVFSGRTGRLWDAPKPINRQNVDHALSYVDGLVAGGGTEMLDAVELALEPELTAGRDRYVVFLTDGFIGNEQEIFAAAKRLVGRAATQSARARVFGIGIGSSPNRELIQGVSRAGDGISSYVTTRERPGRAVERLLAAIDHPVLTNLKVNWDGAKVAAVVGSLDTLFATRPIWLHGRYTGSLDGVQVVARKSGGGTVRIPVTVHHSRLSTEIHEQAWARAQVDDLTERLWAGPDANVEERITELGIEHDIVTAFTSFVAIDHSRRHDRTGAKDIEIVQDAPEAVDLDAAGGEIIGSVDLSATSQSTAGGISIAGGTSTHRYSAEGGVSPSIAENFSTSRDFTAAVEMAPTSEATGRISVAGGTSNETVMNVIPKAHLFVRRNKLAGYEDVRQRVLGQRRKLERCYETESPPPKKGWGSVVLVLDIDAKGRVSAARLEGSLGESAADACLIAAAKQLGGLPHRALRLKLPLTFAYRD
jgi:Ca-activated chloride channel family protein